MELEGANLTPFEKHVLTDLLRDDFKDGLLLSKNDPEALALYAASAAAGRLQLEASCLEAVCQELECCEAIYGSCACCAVVLCAVLCCLLTCSDFISIRERVEDWSQ
jgi:hypothetical protein